MIDVVAHGTGEASALPVPITFALIGGSWALAGSFAVLALAWRKPRLRPSGHFASVGNAFTAVADSAITRTILGVVGIVISAATLILGVVADDEHNPLAGTFYALLWVGLVPLSLIFGPVWRLISPLRAVHGFVCRTVGLDPERELLAYPAWLGRWPAALGLFAFVWIELCSSNRGSTDAILIWLIVYAVIVGVGAILFGRRWFASADPFEVFSETVATMSLLARNPDDRSLMLRGPLSGLSSYGSGPGSVAVIAVLLGSTAFDSFTRIAMPHSMIERTGVMAAFIIGVAATFAAASMATGGVTSAQRRALPGTLAHSLIPIVVGYLIAHYATYFVEEGQEAVGAWWVSLTSGDEPGVWRAFTEHPAIPASIAVSAVVIGHILAVIAAHDAALRALPRRHQLTGQLALMLLMVGYTFTGLYLLFGA
ncbi:hypothetical protein GOEFS_084_00070 [Gordonia effusa NBRC 100432]|uniref:Uncharacterized protein n=1 Tax=Gordonia effusa NBRC 100432 TaxID=1077974 RepID=H0R2W9_9ACTN|nr:hypothetical protein [Gordonia effusa]GAB19420.1 hypothetical protein GOEFS_084_00070 [Gordonia effusa NBRC 100432]